MPPKAKLPQPIDRPLSRAYLREFTGWSTAYPPGLSDPTSLRRMENIMINRDGSARIRPGLRYLSYDALPVDGGAAGTPGDGVPAGTHETFFLNSGAKAYLYAVREVDDTVGFRVLTDTGLGQVVHNLTDPGIEFVITPSEAALNFTAATRYVKFLQIDNKIFALSDAGETMREFFVGETKSAKVLQEISRPRFDVVDKLTVVHPDAAWVNSGTPTSTRTNLMKRSGWELVADSAEAGANTDIARSSTVARSGTYSLAMTSLPEKTNYMPKPLGDIGTYGIGGWTAGTGAGTPVISGSSMRVPVDLNPAGTKGYVNSPYVEGIKAGKNYGIRFGLTGFTAIDKIGLKVRFYNSSNVQVGSDIDFAGAAPAAGQKSFGPATAPAGATKMRIFPFGSRDNATATTHFSINNVMVIDGGAPDAFYTGDSGANYFWTGAANNSSSVYHPPKDITYVCSAPNTAAAYTASVYVRAGTTARNCSIAFTGVAFSADVADSNAAWTRISQSGTPASANPAGTVTVKIKAVPRGETHYIDDGLMELGALQAFFNGDTPDIVGTVYAWTGTAGNSTSTEKIYSAASSIPAAETKTAATLISSTAADNDFNFGFFYTFNNEIGESAPSQATIVATQRPWSAWPWESPNAAGEPSGTSVVDPVLAADQLVASIPQAVFDAAIGMGAIQWNLYMFTWSNQEPVPVSALKVGTRQLSPTSVRDEVGWLAVTPAQSDYGTETVLLPSAASLNFSTPSRGGQGLVAADRMVLVKDPTAQAVIRWTSNQQGSYTDFTANKGGGFKTLTSGNLMIPACVKLWQNPQSADTLTILCMGVDGHSTGYYMAPAQVASQSEATNIMGFEETTATPGTTSPYGVEVFNNTLYHPLDEQLMKSSASNYNINHKSVTDQIQDRWRGLQNKQWIVSSQHDNRLYFIVHNPRGVPLEDNCNGNEIWVFDGMAEAGNWSRFLIQAVSLRKIEQQGKVVMSVVRPDGIYYLDENYGSDDYVSAGVVASRAIPWYLETNTQGANRAHDAWCHLQQVSLIAGNFTGTMRYGIRSYDINGKPVEIAKVFRDLNPPDLSYTFDIQDNLQIRRDLVEWFFFAESVLDDAEAVLPSFGQLNLVQYKYAPVTVNVGYEYGSIETFEYGRATVNWDQRTTDNGVPQPMTDTRRP